MSRSSATSFHVDDVRVIEIQERLAGPRRAVLTVSGEVDHSTCDFLAAALVRTWNARPLAVVVDLRAVDFLNAGGLQVLLLASRTARKRQVPFVLQAEPGQVARLLTLVGLGEQTLSPDEVRAVLASDSATAPTTAAPRPVLRLISGGDPGPGWTPAGPDVVTSAPDPTWRPDLRVVPAR